MFCLVIFIITFQSIGLLNSWSVISDGLAKENPWFSQELLDTQCLTDRLCNTTNVNIGVGKVHGGP